jgi:hypothetical protein
MNDEDPSTNERVMVIVMSFSIMRQVHIKGHPSSMILQKKFTSKTKIRIKIKDTFKNVVLTYTLYKKKKEKSKGKN